MAASPWRLYFAYGSNMLTARLRERVPSAVPESFARLDGHRLAFDKLSLDGSGKATIHDGAPAASSVYGVLFRYRGGDEEGLLRAEEAYAPRFVEVVTAAERRERALSFYALRLDPAVLPYRWYLDLVLAGARQHGLPPEYVGRLAETATRRDDVESRRAVARSILDRAG